MRAILGDNNIRGHVSVLAMILVSEEWRDLWLPLNLSILTFHDLGLPPDTSDVALWRLCQREEILLLTANRNAAGPDSLEATIRNENTPSSLPVFTIGNANQINHSRDYAERVVEKLLDYLHDIENYRGTGRLYLP